MATDDTVTVNGFTMRETESFPPNTNPFNHDGFHMGKGVGNNITLMYRSGPTEHAEYLIIVDKVSGRRVVIEGFASAENEQATPAEGA